MEWGEAGGGGVRTMLLLDIFSIITQWGFCKYVLSQKIKTDIFNKSAFANRKLIVIT